MKLQNKINNLLNLGITNNLEDFTINKNIKVSNLFAFAVITATSFFLFYNLFVRQVLQVAIFEVFSILVYISVFLLNKKMRRNLSRIICFIMGFSQLFVLTYLNGNYSGLPLYFVYGIAVNFLMFSGKEIKKVCITFSILLVLFMTSEYYITPDVALYPPSGITALITRALHAIAVAILIIRIIFHFNKNIRSTTGLLKIQVDKYDYLLRNIYPKIIADKFKAKEVVDAVDIDECSILYADIVGFTEFSKGMNADELIFLLNELFSMFDDDIKKNSTEKIKTIGDAYVVVSGVPEYNSQHQELILKTAQDMFKSLKCFNQKFNLNLSLRVGLTSGSVIAGVLGTEKKSYEIMGDALDLAEELEQKCEVNRVLVHKSMYNSLKNSGYNFIENQNINDTAYFVS